MSGNDASGPLRPPFASDAVASHPGQQSYLCISDLNFSRQRWVPSVYAALHKASGHLIYRSYTAASTHLPPAPSCRHDFKELSPCCQPATVQSSLACCPLDPTRSAQQGASSTYSAERLSEPGCESYIPVPKCILSTRERSLYTRFAVLMQQLHSCGRFARPRAFRRPSQPAAHNKAAPALRRRHVRRRGRGKRIQRCYATSQSEQQQLITEVLKESRSDRSHNTEVVVIGSGIGGSCLDWTCTHPLPSAAASTLCCYATIHVAHPSQP